MSEDIFVNLEFEKTTLGNINQIQVFPSNIAWEDLELMLKVYADQEHLTVKYRDEDGDDILISSQEELNEAFKVAKRCNNRLSIRAICVDPPVSSPDGSLVVNVGTLIPPDATTLPTSQSQPDGETIEDLDDLDPATSDLLTSAPPQQNIARSAGTKAQCGMATLICGMKPDDRDAMDEQVIIMDTEQNETDTGATRENVCFIVNEDRENKENKKRYIREMGKHGAMAQVKASKRVKRDHYCELAQAVGKGSKIMHNEHGGKSSDSSPDGDDCPPPSWFFNYMSKFKKEITEDLARLVARRTVHQVLEGLNNVVIDTVRVTDAGVVHVPPPVPEAGASGSRPIYHHEGVVCDHCDMTVVGIRYKCGNCEDYDLCERCETLEGIHDSDHVFLKIRRPANRTSASRKYKPLLRTSLYKASEDCEEDEGIDREQDRFRRREEKFKYKMAKMQAKMEAKMQRKEEKMKYKIEGTKHHSRQGYEELPRFKVVDMVDLKFIRDDNLPDGTHVQPGTKLVKRWLVRNSGIDPWDDKHMLQMLWGTMSPVQSVVSVPHLKPDQEGIVSVELIAPDAPGTYQSHWSLHHEGHPYGQRIWCNVIVDPKETLEPSAEKTSLLEVTDPPKDTEETEMTENPSGLVQDPSALEALMSYETLAIKDRVRAKASQTATPTNTPRDVTPPKSPTPEQRPLSTSSSVEIVDSPEAIDQDVSRMTDLVQERMASLGLKPNDRVDELDDWSSCDDLLSDDSDSDFYVVPIPDCFNPMLPASTAASTSVIVKKDERRTVDDMLTTSVSDSMHQPILQPTSLDQQVADEEERQALAELQASVEQHRLPSEQTPAEHTLAEQPVAFEHISAEQLESAEQAHDEKTKIVSPEQSDASQTLVKVVNQDVIVVSVQPPESFIIPDEFEASEPGAVGGVDVHIIQDSDETDQNANLPLDINENSAGTPNQEETGTGSQNNTPSHRNPACDPREMSPG